MTWDEIPQRSECRQRCMPVGKLSGTIEGVMLGKLLRVSAGSQDATFTHERAHPYRKSLGKMEFSSDGNLEGAWIRAGLR